MVDGLDGCGKDTHARNVQDLLEKQGEKVVTFSHPSKRWFGRMSKRSLEGSGTVARISATLFYTADILASVRSLRSQKADNVIFVRYLLGTAYLPERLAGTGYKLFRKLLPFPDIALFIDIEPEVAQRRIAARGHRPEMFETIEKLSKVRRIAKRLVASEWTIVDNSTDGKQPFNEVERLLRERSVLRA